MSSLHPLPAPSSFRRFSHAWNRFWFREGPPHLLAIFRIAFGAFVLFYFCLQAPHVRMLYSQDAVLIPFFDTASPFAFLFTPLPAWAAYLLFWTLLVSLLLFILGAWTRASGSIAVCLYLYYWFLSIYQFSTSFDRIFITILLILCFSGCGKTFSVDMWRKKGSVFAWEPISLLAQRIIAVQLTITYFMVGFQKIYLPDWQSGEVLAYGFVGRWATAPAYAVTRLNLPMWFFDALTEVVKAFEIAMPVAFWHKKLRWWAFAGGAFFHTYITIFMWIWWFMVLIPAYVVFFEPEEVQAMLERWRNAYARARTVNRKALRTP